MATAEPRQVVLVVDDVSRNVDICEEILSDHYDIITASNGQQAIEIATEELPDVILMDLMA